MPALSRLAPVVSRAAPLCAAVALAACTADFRPQYRVEDLRILGARAVVVGSPPPGVSDADLGDRVRLEALVANPGAVPDVTVDWFACLPVQGSSVTPCADPSALADPARLATLPGVLALGRGESIEVTVPAEAGPLVDEAIARAAARPELACTLYVELPTVAVLRGGGVLRTAAKPVRIYPEARLRSSPYAGVYVRNRNPAIAEVRASPTDVGACTGGAAVSEAPLPRRKQKLCALEAAGSVQVSSQCDADGNRFPLAEELKWQWYVSAGELDTGGGLNVGNATGGDVDLTPPPGPFTLWVILRDGRGGEDWLRQELR